ncbi:hypothetical protein RN001_012374 [Aquatica leii]|uniref:Uncharacterized protein n=1 Tax=Aquatica leii TaxID=1421715 RepID=A0AAN7P3S2_9COLE|nr:hypothetical protein RN001_012374 [Aquatica leii]
MSSSELEVESFCASESKYYPEKFKNSESSFSVASFKKNQPYKIFYKETLNEEFPFEVINLLPNRKGIPTNFKNNPLEPLYESPLPVNKKKKKNMEEFFQFIPPVYQQYFKNIITTTKHVDENSGQLEFDLEEDA